MKKNLLFIPESRKRPITESLLYKQIVRFFEEEKIRDKFEIAFITIESGIVNQESGESGKHNSLFMIPNSRSLPPRNFRSGSSGVTKEQIEQMADNIVEFIKTKKQENIKTIVAYCRGAYLEAVNLANQELRIRNEEKTIIHNSCFMIQSIFSDDELALLKKKGIRWMKIGLRMEEAFTIFQKRIRELLRENETRQLKLF